MPKVDPVILQLKAEIDGYRRDLSSAQALTDAKLDAIERRGHQMGVSLRRGFDVAKVAAIGFAAALPVEAIVRAIGAGLEYASSLGEQAQQLGITTAALQEYRYAATQVGLSAEEMDQAISQLTRRIGEAESGTKAQAEAFDKLGISVKGMNGETLNAAEAIPQIAEALRFIESPAQRAAILMDLFGRAGQRLEPLLAGGSAAVNQLRNAAHELGVVLSERQIQQADDTADKLAAVKTVLSARIAGVVADNAGAIMTLANALAQIVNWAGKAANAYKAFKLSQGIAQEESKMSSMFSTEASRGQAIERANLYRAELARMNGTQDKSGGFRDYNAAPIPGYSGASTPGGVASPPAIPSAGGAGAGGGGGGGGRAGPSGPSAADIRNRLDDQLASYAQQAISAMQAVAKSADERAELENRSVELARVRTLADINTSNDFSEAQKERLRAQVESLADRERERVEFQRKIQNERDQADLAGENYKAANNELQQRYDLTDSQTERKQIALDLLDLEYRYQKALLDSVIASETAADVDKQRATIALGALNAAQSGRRDQASRANASVGEKYLADLNKEALNLDDAFQQIAINGLEDFNKGLSDAVKSTLGLHGVLGNIIGDFIELALRQSLLKPLAESLLGGGGGGGGGIFGKLFGAVTGISGKAGLKLAGARADGGPVGQGKPYLVGERGPEIFVPSSNGGIVPNGGSVGKSVVEVHVMEGQLFEPRVQAISGEVSVQVVRSAAPAIVNASARETMARARRPKI